MSAHSADSPAKTKLFQFSGGRGGLHCRPARGRALRCVLAVLMAAMLAVVPVSAWAQAPASVDVVRTDETIKYSNHDTTIMKTADGKIAYCVEPNKGTPASGTYQIEKASDDVAVALWASYDSPGFDESLFPAKYYDGSDWSRAKYIVASHILVSYAYTGSFDDATYGTEGDEAFQKWAREELLVGAGTTWVEVQKLKSNISDTFEAFIVNTGSSQTLASYYIKAFGGVQVTKLDKELGASEAVGGSGHDSTVGASLEGIQFAIANGSDDAIMIDGVSYEAGEAIMTITTAWNATAGAYTAQTSSDALPEGIYTVHEVASNASYMLSDTSVKTFKITESGVLVTVDAEGKPLDFSDQVVRNDLEIHKKAAISNKSLQVPFVITNVATGEAHVIVTDRNGDVSTASGWNAHSNNTNGNDSLIGKEGITAADMDDTAGIWFSLGEDGSHAPVRDELGAMPYGEYTLVELPCEANEGLTLISKSFWIERDSTAAQPAWMTLDDYEEPEEPEDPPSLNYDDSFVEDPDDPAEEVMTEEDAEQVTTKASLSTTSKKSTGSYAKTGAETPERGAETSAAAALAALAAVSGAFAVRRREDEGK